MKFQVRPIKASAYQIDPLHDPRWGEFLLRHPRASVFHTPAWLEALRRTYGYTSRAYTTASPGIALTNGLVGCRVNSPITGRRTVSLSFSDHCEPLVDSADELESLIRVLELDSMRDGSTYLELRPRMPLPVPPRGWERAQEHYLHALDLTPDLEEIFRRLHRNSIQQVIRRAEREGLTYDEGRSAALREQFYHLLIRTRRRQHLPPHPRVWFSNLADCLGDTIKFRIASQAGRPIASIVTLSFKDVLVYKYGCSDERFHSFGGMQFLFWHALQEAKRNGAREFDLGRTDRDNAGLITFKERWGAVRSPLTYWRYPPRLAPVGPTGWRSTVARTVLPHFSDSLLIAACSTRPAKRIFRYIPDTLLVAAGTLFYKHIG